MNIEILGRLNTKQRALLGEAINLEQIDKNNARLQEIYRQLENELGLSPDNIKQITGSFNSTPDSTQRLFEESTVTGDPSGNFGDSSGQRQRLFEESTITSDPSLRAGTGSTDKFGNITYSTAGSPNQQAAALYHEQVHSVLSPKLRFFRNFRADLGQGAYSNSNFLRYLEEFLAEAYAQLRVNGIRGLPTAIRFPVANGYVTVQAVAIEGVIGAVVIGRIKVIGDIIVYDVYLEESNKN